MLVEDDSVPHRSCSIIVGKLPEARCKWNVEKLPFGREFLPFESQNVPIKKVFTESLVVKSFHYRGRNESSGARTKEPGLSGDQKSGQGGGVHGR